MSDITDKMGYKSPFGKNSLFAESVVVSEDWKYRIVPLSNGTELIDQYIKYDYSIEEAKGNQNPDTDFIIYIEIPEENQVNIDISRVVLTKMSRLMREYLIANQTFIPLIAEEIARREQSKYKLTKEELAKAFELELRYRSSKDIQFLDEMYTENELTETFLDAVSDGFRGLKIAEEYWNPDLKSKNYLGPERFVNMAVGNLQKLYRNLKAIKEFLAKNKDNVLARNLAQFIDSAMKDIASMIQWLLKLKKLTQVQFAFLCGMINGCIEFLAGIVDMVVLAIKIRNQMVNGTITGELELEMMMLTETVENLMEQYIKDPDFLKKQMAEAMKGYVDTRYNSSLSRYVIAHNAGEDTIIAIDIVLSVITIVKGVGKLSTKLPKFNKWIDEVLARNGKGALKAEEALQEARRTKKLIGVIEYEILSPNLLRKYIDDAVELCRRKGVKLEIRWIDNTHPRFNEPDYLGGFRITNDKNKVILNLRPECPKITWYHEHWHMDDFLEMGWKKYTEISKKTPWKHEEAVWKRVYQNRNKWSEPELVDAYLYYKNYIEEKSIYRLSYYLKEMEDLGKQLGLIK